MKRKVNVFGIELSTVNEQQLLAETGGTGRHVVLCVRVAELPNGVPWPRVRARSFKTRCSRCRELIWHDPQASPYPIGASLVCMTCFMAASDEERKELWDL